MRKIFMLLAALNLSVLAANVRESDQMEAILKEVDAETVVFFDIDETLIESSTQLAGKAWRRYALNVLKKAKGEVQANRLHDEMTYFLAHRIPYVAVEPQIPHLVKDLQEQQIPIFALTARAKDHWYDRPSPDTEALTVEHLQQAGLILTRPPESELEALFSHPSYAQGIFFGYLFSDKGALVSDLFSLTESRPKILFVDDKKEQAKSVDAACECLGIQSISFYYPHVEQHRSFDPMIAHIQLEKLLLENRLLSDEEAKSIKDAYQNKDPDAFFLELCDHFVILKEADRSKNSLKA